MSKVFVNVGLSPDGYMAPEGMTMGKPEYTSVRAAQQPVAADGPLRGPR